MERLFIWGTGLVSRQVLERGNIFECYDIIGFIDNDVKKIGEEYFGKKIYAPDILFEIVPDKIVILTDKYEEIRNQIERDHAEMLNLIENKNYFYKKSIMKRYGLSAEPEMASILRYLERNDLQVFNYEYVKKYKNMEIEAAYDQSCGLFYVIHNGARMYFARFLNSEAKVIEYYRSLLIEQDTDSPHRYTDDGFCVLEGATVVDVGVAEGNFSLDIIDKASKVYLIETNEDWIEALKKTFEKYMDKIVILRRFASSMDQGIESTLDSLIHEPVDFVKMDIEGSECDALLGMKGMIDRSPNLKCAICAYHREFDEIVIKRLFAEYGMKCSTTQGYMWFSGGQERVSTKLCRGIVRASK